MCTVKSQHCLYFVLFKRDALEMLIEIDSNNRHCFALPLNVVPLEIHGDLSKTLS